LPSLHLHVCGPIYGEKDFTDEYKKELEETPNVHVYGRLDVGGEKFAEILEKCASVIYPSGGDGTAGAIIQAMHAGLVPIITPETGIQENAGYISIENPTTESVRQAVLNFAIMQPNVIKSKSRSIWQYARSFYTKENFLKSYAKFIDEILKL
jgi:glycosyltransferase involved in cell wall biosynthesis